MAETKKSKILVVEDDLAMRGIVIHKLTKKGFEVVEAGDGKTALDVFTKEKPDLVLLDLMLPELDGFGVLTKIRTNADKKLANTPVIALTNMYEKASIEKAKALNIYGYFVKAYLTTEEVAQKIQEALAAQKKS